MKAKNTRSVLRLARIKARHAAKNAKDWEELEDVINEVVPWATLRPGEMITETEIRING